MDTRRQHQGMHAPLQSQHFPPLLQQGGVQPPRLSLPLPHPNTAFNPRTSSHTAPLAGQKRSNRPSDSGTFTKLFVASLPRNISEEEVHDLFGGFGNVLEVVFLKDKKTGLPQGCCFIKYANVMDAERAIRVLDNQRTLPGGPAPLQVKFADSERDHQGPMEHKLFVGSLNRQAGEREIEEIFAPYGRVDNVYLIKDDQKQSRGCAFVTFPEKEMAIAAISALNGVFRMPGCHQPIIVRFADPKRPRSGERDTQRGGGGGSNFSPRSHQVTTGPNFRSNYDQGAGGQRGSGQSAMEAHGPAFGWRQGAAGGMGLLPQAGLLPLGASSSISAFKGHLENPSSAMGFRGGNLAAQGTPAISSQTPVSDTSTRLSNQQGFKDSPLHKSGQGYGQPLSSHQQPMHPSLSSIPLYSQGQSLQGFSMPQSTDTRSQYSSPQLGLQMYGLTSVALKQLQQQSIPLQQQSNQQPITTMSSLAVQFQPLRQQDSEVNQAQNAQPLQQIPQLQSIPSQMQSQAVGKEMPQQVYVQPLQMMNQSSVQPASWQPSWSIPQSQAVPSQQQTIPSQQQVNPSLHQTTVLPSQQPVNPLQQQGVSLQQPAQQQAVSSVATPALTPVPTKTAPTVASCDWTEHVSPEGHKYYYNSTTGESRWEKPEEFAAFEKQQQSGLPLQQQQPPLHQQQSQQLHQNQVQAPVQQLQPQQYQQQHLLNHQSQHQVQQALSQQLQSHQQQQTQSQMQTLQTQLQQPQLQQLPLLQHLPQVQKLQQQLQQSQSQLQQLQRESQLTSSGLQISQLSSGNGYQMIQGYTQVQAASQQPAIGIANGSHFQQFVPTQQQVQANGVSDTARGAQWVPPVQQGVPNQDYAWKPKPAGS